MTLTIPPELKRFIDQQVASGRYTSAEEVVSAGLQLLRESSEQFEHLRQEVKRRIERLECGESIELDGESLGAFFDEIEGEVDDELAAQRKQGQ